MLQGDCGRSVTGHYHWVVTDCYRSTVAKVLQLTATDHDGRVTGETTGLLLRVTG